MWASVGVLRLLLIIAATTGFATETSWGTVGILIPPDDPVDGINPAGERAGLSRRGETQAEPEPELAATDS